MRLYNGVIFSSAAVLFVFTQKVPASPYASAGDVYLRNQIQILEDEGLLDGLSSTWPCNLGDLYYNLQASDYSESCYNFVGTDLMERLMAESDEGIDHTRIYINAGTNSQPFRSFYSFERDNFETGIETSLMTSHYVINLNTTYVPDPSDGNKVRFDGSYAGISYGNWTLAVDQVERWWGPGWEGSLILSNNARSFPAISLSRNISKPFDLPVLEYLGNWTFTTFMGELVDDDLQSPSHPLIFGMRFEMRPFDWLEIGLSRTALWGGAGRPQNFDTFYRLFVGNDNNDSSLTTEKEPGDQLAGIDFRLKPLKKVPVAAYGQMIGEDLGGFMPIRLMVLGGLETWGIFAPIKDSTWRVHIEYADSAARFNLTRGPDDISRYSYSYAYNHHIYTEGYRYKDSCLGHAMDGDGGMLSIGGLVCESKGRYWGLLLRRTEIDRHNNFYYEEVHTVCRDSASVNSVETYGGFRVWNIAVKWALSYMDYDDAPLLRIKSEVQASVSLSYSF